MSTERLRTKRSRIFSRTFAIGAPFSVGASQPVFGPARLTNGLTDRFDHFLGYATQPEPLQIVVDLGREQQVARIVVHETAVGGSYEVYELLVSADGRDYEQVGAAGERSRGERSFVEHRFASRKVRYVKIATHGCHGLTFPSFSRLCEVEVFLQ
jgi:hexosaminidase